jgi:preprotein translocase subunit YajC
MVKKRKTYLVNMHESIQVGKRIIFAGGIFGKIVEINGDIITVEVKKGAHLEVSRYSVSEVLEKE